ncbi:leucyl aminopeptidase [Candidatus Poribacteria bacterium]|jgi:leucyl aminopeptidase|nr:leucyl aminopeptidase [Candidatus Poribacteria bacterium]MBT5536189.1 leucyl aminopeptidase [Candidatus Poribacteria bacterium]
MTQTDVRQGGPETVVDVSSDLALYKGDGIVVGVFADGELSPTARSLDAAVGGMLTAVCETGDMSGKKGAQAVVYTHGKIPAPRVLMVGLGRAKNVDAERLRCAAGDAARKLRDSGCRGVGMGLHAGLSLSTTDAGEAIAEGVLLALYRSDLHHTRSTERKELDTLTLLDADAAARDRLSTGAQLGEIIAAAANTARDLANEAPNYLPPLALADRARDVAETAGLTCRVLETEDLKAEGFNTLLGVGQGSVNPPVFIILEHEGDADEAPLVLVGKGICFDSGGLSLKSGAGMMGMKHDMAGAAAVIGAMGAIGSLDLPRRVIGLVAAAENMPSATAQRPNDIVYSLSGKTIEVRNTDAEGRLVLADALAYAARYEPAGVIDLATLTGACMTALGKHTCGMFGKHDRDTDALIARVQAAADATHERVWRLPLWDDYDDEIKSDIADVQNIGSSGLGGAIVGAAFLKAFVDGYPWVHLDIAGLMTSSKNKGYAVKGATGFGARLLTELARNWGV